MSEGVDGQSRGGRVPATGRPQVPGITVALRAAAAEILAARSRVTVDEVTRRAGTTRATFSRRYPSIDHLVAEVTTKRLPATTQETEPLVGDVRVVLGQWRDALTDPATANGVVRVIASRDPGLQERMIRGWRDTVDRMLGRAVQRGEASEPVDPVGVFSLMLGPLLVRTVYSHDPARPADDRFLDRHARTVAGAVAGLRGVA